MIFHVYANQSNAGDWLSAQGIQSLLAPRPVRELFCDGPFVPGTLAALEAAGSDDFIVIGGGGLFMDYFAPFWEGFRSIATRVPFAIWGVGVCDLKRQNSRLPQALLREIVASARLCVVRDELSRDLLGLAGLPPPVSCPTLVAVPTSRSEGQMLLHVDHHDGVGAVNFERMEAVAWEFAARSGRRSQRTNNLIARGNHEQLQRLLGLYAASDLVLSSRLHGCIIALAAGRRVLAVSGDYKVEAFMREAGLSDWVLDLHQLEALPGRLGQLPAQPLPRAFVESGRRKNRAVAAAVTRMADATAGQPAAR